MAEISSATENKTLGDFYQNVTSKEPSIRLECFPAMENFLLNNETSLDCDDLPGFINGLIKWIEGSNFRIAHNGLRTLEMLIDRLDSNEFGNYVEQVTSATADRLGDSKDQVREAASNLLIKLMTTYTVQRIWDLIQPLVFDSKQFRIKEESQRLLIRSLDEFGASTIQLSKLVPLICKLVSDSNGAVRQQAIDTLVEIYRHVGERIRGDIAKRDIPEAKLKQLYEKFDDVIATGRMIAKASDLTEDTRPKSSTTRSRLNSDSSTTSIRSRPSGGIPTRTTSSISAVSSSNNSRIRSSSSISRPHASATITTTTTGAAASGAVDEALFEDAFNSSHAMSISSGKDVENQLLAVREILADTNNDWEKRVEAIKRLRSIISGGGDQYDEFFRTLRQLDLPLVATVKDLRSQIVREICITLAFMSIRLTNRLERTVEFVLPAMLNLIQNSVKVMATSGTVALRYIITNTQSSKLIPLILDGSVSKSKDIRRQAYELLVIILSQWNFVYLEKHGQLMHDVIKKGLSDADAEARSNARKAFGSFREHFPAIAETLLASLEPSKKKTLMGEMSNASSTHSLASVGSSRIRSGKETASRQLRRESIEKQNSSSNLARSSSANELALRQKNSLTNSLNSTGIPTKTSRTRYLPQQSNVAKSASTTSARPPQIVSQSQPGSRSTSPNSLRLSYLSSSSRTPTNARARIPISSNGGSRISSRESSPGRTTLSINGVSGNRRRSGRSYGYRGPGSDYGDHGGQRRVSGSWYGDSGDDASETSSICSERSLEDIADVLRRMSSNEWAERKESLSSLYHMIRAGRAFSPPELKRLTELLTKRFYDPHSQVFASFLDVLPEFIIAYKRELNDWLYALLTRLLIRLGAADLLDSVAKKLKHCLTIVNSSFDVHAQFTVLIRFVNDNSSAPSVKAKEIVLRYLQQVIQHMEPVDITNKSDIRTALSKIINWSSEPKSIEMRKAAQAVIFALYNLNRPEFNLMLTALPQDYQDTAAKIIQSANDTPSQLDNKYDFFRRTSLSGLPSPMTTSMHSDVHAPTYASDMRILMENMQALNVNHRQEDSLMNSALLKDKEHRSMIPVRHHTSQSYHSRAHQTEPSDSISDATDRPEAIDQALNTANNNAASKDQRQHALRCILKFAKINDIETWDLAFSKTLNVVTQILDNPTDDIIYKVYSLRILRELLIHHTNLFMNYIELTIFRILKAQSESESEITRFAEQAAHAAAEHLPAENTVRVLKPIIEQAKYPMNQSAIAMLQKTIELMNKEICIELMPEMIPPLLTSWDNETSSVRKAAVFCLVSIYMVVGDALRTHLHKLSASKLKLLNVYISKAQQQTTTSVSEKSTPLNGLNNNQTS